jgi:hypothetical protein
MNIDATQELKHFIDTDIGAAIEELDNITTVANRKHLQRLVYTNLVDRFDSMIDHQLLANATAEPIFNEAMEKYSEPIPEGELLQLLSGDGVANRISNRTEQYVRDKLLNKRHSIKLEKLFNTFLPSLKVSKYPLVNPNTGTIAKKKYTPKNKNIPASICGYADWLYSRRNSVVHGAGGTKLLKRDVEKLKSIYGTTPAETVKLSIGSIKTASQFYFHVAIRLEGAA